MIALTDPLRHHHQHCDELFVATEAAAAEGDWPACQLLLTRFHGAIEDHFSSEETLLFPAFEAATGMAGGPTHMMRSEHAQMRGLLEQMQGALTAQAGDAFAGAAETLLVFMQQHNMKEENILYPMCDRSLAGQADGLDEQLRERLATA
ncbi:MAG: hemerythrin domain-containing protein [Rhodocyclaceae bacterium]|nr:hemerythrin domain-containing protein [Rhodocyclaceae bacterium]MDP1958018.1 hemerythrin domain-containing protein [Rhodocyclaceae bacterium]